MGSSEVAQLRQQIELEISAMRRGMTGLAQGTARHDFIHRRMERIGDCQNSLARKVGEAVATQMVCVLYMQVMEQETL